MAPAYPLVFFVTVNWRRGLDTVACLQSLAAQTYRKSRILVMDNGSADGSVELIRSSCPDAEVLESAENLGFARGANLALRHALAQGADLVFLVNNDTRLANDALERMLPHLQQDIGLIAPMIYYAELPDRIWSAGGSVHPVLLEIMGDVRGQVDEGHWPELMERDFVTGCGMLLTRRLLENVGLFDERFFMYYEDADLCWRARQAGFRILLVSKAKMWHQVSLSSGGADTVDERYWMARSSAIFFRKHARGLRWLAIVPWRSASAVKTTLRLIRAGKRRACAAYWRGLRDGWQES